MKYGVYNLFSCNSSLFFCFLFFSGRLLSVLRGHSVSFIHVTTANDLRLRGFSVSLLYFAVKNIYVLQLFRVVKIQFTYLNILKHQNVLFCNVNCVQQCIVLCYNEISNQWQDVSCSNKSPSGKGLPRCFLFSLRRL